LDISAIAGFSPAWVNLYTSIFNRCFPHGGGLFFSLFYFGYSSWFEPLQSNEKA
jgi:hypothetical protein